MASVALQLYTLRNETKADFLGTLGQVAAIGYPAVEFAGLFGHAPSEVRAQLDRLGLVAASTHTAIAELRRDLAGVVDMHRALGCGIVTVPFLPQEDRADLAGYERTAHELDNFGRQLLEGGLQLCYHNHNFEFAMEQGRCGMDVLRECSDPAHLHFQVDVFWVAKAGIDPVSYIRTLGARCATLHIKDMAPDGSFAEVGHGTLELPAMMAAGDAVGARWFIVEQDSCTRPPLEAVRMSLESLTAWGRI